MDIQPGMLQRVQEKARAANLTNIQFLEAGAGAVAPPLAGNILAGVRFSGSITLVSMASQEGGLS